MEAGVRMCDDFLHMESVHSSTIRKYRWLMIFFGLAYAAGAAIYFFFPAELIYVLNFGPQVFGITQPLTYPPEDRFWLMQAVAMLAMLSALSFLSAEKPSVQGYAIVHILAKVIEGLGFVTLLLNDQTYFAYILAIVLDVLIALVVTWSLFRVTRALKARQREEMMSPMPQGTSETRVFSGPAGSSEPKITPNENE